MKYLILIFLCFFCCSCSGPVETKGVMSLTPFSADVSIRLRCEEYQEAGVIYYLAARYGTYHPYNIALDKGNDAQDANPSIHISNLEPNKRYYYRSYVQKDNKLYCGKMCKLTTPPYKVDFTIGQPRDITYCSAEIDVSVEGGESSPVDCVGFVYSRYHDHIIHAKGQQSRVTVDEGVGTASVTVNFGDLYSNTTYYYCPFANHDGNYTYGPICTLTTPPFHIEAVDLGLSVLWATSNVGASGPEQRGSWFSWAETREKALYIEKYYDILDCFERMSGHSGFVPVYIVPAENICGTEWDAATVNLGDGWRMPTDDEIQELIDSCQWTPELFRRKYGMRVTGPSGETIFIPLSSRRGPDVMKDDFWSGIVSYDKPLYEGRSVRPVKDKKVNID